MKAYTEYTVEIDWETMTQLIEKHDFGYLERAIKEIIIWCETNFTDDKDRWRYYSINSMSTSKNLFAFRNESDRTLFLLKWA